MVRAILLFIFLITSIPTFAQDRPMQLLYGYTINIDEGYVGLTFAFLNETVGFYFTGVFSGGKPADNEYMQNISYNAAKYTYQDQEKGEMWNGLYLSGGLTHRLNDNFSAYAGISVDSRTQYINFFDHYYILGNGGNYYVDGNEQGGSVGANFGVIYSAHAELANFYILAGANSSPASLQLGIGIFTDIYPSIFR